MSAKKNRYRRMKLQDDQLSVAPFVVFLRGKFSEAA